ncbi:MAG: SDR family NAD(P)-dependent oxidoreductase, partial [Acetobacteraceae bacterium]|nr:SDR family NAD(P)-dependent oxidoreductase [Acetobacteraceae bacterium]
MRNVLVSGGSRGLGLAIVRALARGGDRVIAVARRSTDELQVAVQEAAEGGGAICFRPFDLSATTGIPDLLASLRAEFGPLYGLVNSAALGTPGVLATMPDERIEQLVQLNVVSPITLT